MIPPRPHFAPSAATRTCCPGRIVTAVSMPSTPTAVCKKYVPAAPERTAERNAFTSAPMYPPRAAAPTQEKSRFAMLQLNFVSVPSMVASSSYPCEVELQRGTQVRMFVDVHRAWYCSTPVAAPPPSGEGAGDDGPFGGKMTGPNGGGGGPLEQPLASAACCAASESMTTRYILTSTGRPHGRQRCLLHDLVALPEQACEIMLVRRSQGADHVLTRHEILDKQTRTRRRAGRREVTTLALQDAAAVPVPATSLDRTASTEHRCQARAVAERLHVLTAPPLHVLDKGGRICLTSIEPHSDLVDTSLQHNYICNCHV